MKKTNRAASLVLLLLMLSIFLVPSVLHADQPRRTGLYLGIDPGFVLEDVAASEFPILFRLDFRPGYCVTDWFHIGINWVLDFTIQDFDHYRGKTDTRLLQPTFSFFPYEGLFTRIGGGWDPTYQDRYSVAGHIGYEWGVGTYGGIGLGVSFTQLFHTDDLPHFQQYTLVITFTGYHLLRDVPF